MPSPPVDAEGIREVLSLVDRTEVDLERHAARACRRLAQCIGSAAYATLLDDSMDIDDMDACIDAGRLFGAASFYRTKVPPVGSRGIAFSISRGEGVTESAASGEEVAKSAAAYANEAIQILREVGRYVQPATSVMVVTELDDAEDET